MAQLIPKHLSNRSLASLPQALLESPHKQSQIDRIQQIAASILKHCDGLLIPGGEDIESEFYGKKISWGGRFQNLSPSDFPLKMLKTKRSMLEFALIQGAQRKKMITMGTCRGSQMINVFFGGTLKNLPQIDYGLSRLKLVDSPFGRWLKNLVGDHVISFSAHHQAYDRMGSGLQVILEKNGIPKFFVSEDGLFLGSQIHPEVYIDLNKKSDDVSSFIAKQNQSIYDYFVRLIKQQANHSHAKSLTA